MKCLVCCALLLSAAPMVSGAAQEVDVEKIKNQVLEELKPLIEAEVQRRLQEELAKRPLTPAPAPTPAVGADPSPWTPARPIPLLRAGPAFVNLSLVGDVVFGWSTEPDVESLQSAHHDPRQRGFSLTAGELVLEGAVDPYFKGLATTTLVIEPGGNTAVELEEAWLQTTALPWNLQIRAGQFYSPFGRQNILHAHAWSFVDQSLVNVRMFGPDGLRNPGAQFLWLAPTPFFTELTLGVFNSDGVTASSFRHDDSWKIHGGKPIKRGLRGPQDLLYVPRIATSFDLTETQTLLLGLSGAFGPNNSGMDTYTQIYGADVYWKWRPVTAQKGFPFVSWQTEALYRRYEAASRESKDQHDPPATRLPAETLGDWGFYSQVLWGFKPRWVAGLRGEFVSANTGAYDSEWRADRTRISPNLTWYPTEFSKIRLQYNYDHRQRIGDDHSVWLQLEFLLGTHGAHKF